METDEEVLDEDLDIVQDEAGKWQVIFREDDGSWSLLSGPYDTRDDALFVLTEAMMYEEQT